MSLFFAIKHFYKTLHDDWPHNSSIYYDSLWGCTFLLLAAGLYQPKIEKTQNGPKYGLWPLELHLSIRIT